ncbi:DUF3817 domain-containing protein [Demequina pelophila]|uniref:DUF3817 domain-containing protein n=1 Tax=Demequina pelophila TaxID=1638984 RepID=UPI0007846DA3|nr:DUF3817 domain-containing protein [Demequina pelophila]
MSDAGPIRGALLRYRVMAIITGTLLLIVTVGMLRYLPGLDGVKEALDPILLPVAIVHGWVFIVYLAAVAHLWMLMRWGIVRLVFMAAGGVVPVLSFVAERRVTREVATTVGA